MADEADGYLICMNIGGCRLDDGLGHFVRPSLYLKLSLIDQDSESK